jgi:hypothetical protein
LNQLCPLWPCLYSFSFNSKYKWHNSLCHQQLCFAWNINHTFPSVEIIPLY